MTGVPAIVVSPWVAKGSVSHALFDHTSIAKTILSRFCPAELERQKGADALVHWLERGHPHYMGERVAKARDPGELLGEDAAREPPDRAALVDWVAARHADTGRRLATTPVSFHAEDRLFTDLHHGMLAAEQHLRTRGLPTGQP